MSSSRTVVSPTPASRLKRPASLAMLPWVALGLLAALVVLGAAADEDANARDFARALAAGAICYLTKPFDGDSLIRFLQAALKTHDGEAGN